jgi:hypothetical protein
MHIKSFRPCLGSLPCNILLGAARFALAPGYSLLAPPGPRSRMAFRGGNQSGAPTNRSFGIASGAAKARRLI